MRGERMTEGVGTDVLVDSGPVNGFAQDREDHHTGKLCPPVVEEHDVRCGRFSRPVVEVTLNLFTSRPADRYEALFVSLARHADITFSEKKVAQPQRGEFRNAQPARIEDFEHRAVPPPLDRRGIYGGNDAIDLFDRKNVREVTAEFGRIDELGRGRIDHVGQHQVVVKATDTAQSPRLRGFLPSLIVQKGQVALDHRSFDLAGRHVVEPEDEVGELTQIAHVGFDGILREPFFQFDINAVTAADFFPFFESFCHFYLTL